MRSERVNPELSGAIVRIFFGAFIAITLYLGMSFGGFTIGEAQYSGFFFYFFSYSLVYLAVFYRWQNHFWLRISAVFLDIITATLAIALTDGPHSPFFLIYVWFWISTGTRFGKTYLLITAVMAFVCYHILALLQGYWAQHAYLLMIQSSLMVMIPLYMSGLLGQLHQAKQDAEAASRAKSAFLANMSHEMRTPLVGIIGMTKLIRSTAITSEQAGFLTTQERSARILLALIDDILDVSKLEAEKVELVNESFCLRETIEGAYALLAPMAREKGLKIDYVLDEAIPEKVFGDELRFIQILNNLVGNAIKYTRQGAISLRVRPVSSQGQSGRLRFEVHDTGIGMTREQQKVIFDTFRQAESSTTKEYGGTGLGTTIAKRLVELMAGTIGVESHPGKGTCFWFELPLKAVEPEADEREVESPSLPALEHQASSQGKRLLLVEDNAINSYVHSRLLTDMGYEVTVRRDGLEALLQQNEGFDLVLMDMCMPNMDGPTAAREWRKRESEGVHVPIIALTANSSPEDIHHCIESGMDDFMSKPIDPDHMQQVIARHLESGSR